MFTLLAASLGIIVLYYDSRIGEDIDEYDGAGNILATKHQTIPHLTVVAEAPPSTSKQTDDRTARPS